MLRRSVDISVPNAQALPFAEAVEAAGPAEQDITGIVLGIVGEMNGTVLLLVPPADADAHCRCSASSPTTSSPCPPSARSATSSAPRTSTRSPA